LVIQAAGRKKKMDNPIQENISELLDKPYFESDNYQISIHQQDTFLLHETGLGRWT
jgi:hypothetical protein